MKTKMIALVVLSIFVLASASVVSADGGYQRGYGKKSLDDTVLMKIHTIMANKEDLAITDEQLSKLKTLKINIKKDLIRKKADIELLAIDIKAKMYDAVINTESINALIDQKYDIKKAKAKAVVAALAEVKTILTDEQEKKLDALKKACFTGKMDKMCTMSKK